jgi:hypothetical protein
MAKHSPQNTARAARPPQDFAPRHVKALALAAALLFAGAAVALILAMIGPGRLGPVAEPAVAPAGVPSCGAAADAKRSRLWELERAIVEAAS